MPKQPEFIIKAHGITAVESNSNGFSDWAELTLDVQYGTHVRRIELTRAAAQDILDELNRVLKPWAGKSIRESVQEELDTVVERLLADGRPSRAGIDVQAANEWQAYGEERGQAQGLAIALAIFNNPYKPNVPETKREAVERVKARES